MVDLLITNEAKVLKIRSGKASRAFLDLKRYRICCVL